MAAPQPPFLPFVRHGIRLQLTGIVLLLALALLVAVPARTSRLQAVLLLLAGLGLVLDARGLRANAALLATAEPTPRWIPWVSGVSLALGIALVLCALVFAW